MFTWNIPYVSKARLAETLSQLSLNRQKGDVLVRIHTAIHSMDEALDIAGFIKETVPRAVIFGTSTSAVINRGKMLQNQCIISISLMSPAGKISSVFLPEFDENGKPVSPDDLCKKIKDSVIKDDTKLLLAFLTQDYKDIHSFAEKSNEYFPGVKMTGGFANTPKITLKEQPGSGFVFNDKECSARSMIVAALSGKDLECLSSYATGVQSLGDAVDITDTFGSLVLKVDTRDAAEAYRLSIGDSLKESAALTNLFPCVYSDAPDIPVFVRFSDDKCISDLIKKDDPANEAFYEAHKDTDTDKVRELINADHNVEVGKKVKRAFIYDRKIISDNRSLFRKIENFEKAETIFAYSGITRSEIYSNCVKWELSAYENSNVSGCITGGEFAFTEGKNVFANCSFVVSVMGEAPAVQECNPYAFSHTDSLAEDNRELINYLMKVEAVYEKLDKSGAAESLKNFVRDCELKLLYSEKEDIPNAAALNMDMSIKGYDRVCVIHVSGTASMRTVFPDQMIELTYRNYLNNCNVFAKEKHYGFYIIDKWTVALSAPSYMVSLNDFASDMERLQRKLFESKEDFIAIVPNFCIINDATADNLIHIYNSARLNMMNRNIQFIISDASSKRIDEEKIREEYHMVNVINYAIAHDKVIPYFQGINDNKTNKIHHYEALMRLEDENGKVYLPGSFLDVARNYGLLYDSISGMMLKKVFAQFKDREDSSVSINLGMRDIRNREVTEYIYAFLSTAKHPENFIFEILENEDINDYDLMIRFVDKVHALGGLISIDDFGSGYSNLQHVLSIHLDYLKLDGSIIRNCTTSKDSENLIALIAGYKKLTDREIRIVAEFVEDKNIQKILMKYNIDFSQGYLFAKPEPTIGKW